MICKPVLNNQNLSIGKKVWRCYSSRKLITQKTNAPQKIGNKDTAITTTQQELLSYFKSNNYIKSEVI